MSDAAPQATPVPTTPTPLTNGGGAAAPVPPASDAPASAASDTLLTTPTAPAVPEKYEFTAPEIDGKPIEVDPEALTGFQAAAKDAGLTQEQFAKIAPLGAQLIAQKVQAALAGAMPEHLRPDTQTKWVETIKQDAEIGGDKLGPALAQAAKAIDAYGGAELKDALNVTRAGNHPAVVKFFAAIGKAMGDAEGLLTGKPVSTKAINPEARARDFYNARGGSYPPVVEG